MRSSPRGMRDKVLRRSAWEAGSFLSDTIFGLLCYYRLQAHLNARHVRQVTTVIVEQQASPL